MKFDVDLSDVPGVPVLVGVGGSHAYGLAHEHSDVDFRGVYVAPTRNFFGLDTPPDTHDRHEPDMALHEVAKFLKLAMNANPTVLENLFYSEYVIKTDIGALLIENRDLFITERIRATHAGFAMSQLGRLRARQQPDEWFAEPAPDPRVSKHARHLLRLIQQAERALTTGVFDIRVNNREEIFHFGELPYEYMIGSAAEAVERLKEAPCVLPAAPDRDAINSLLIEIRTVALDW